MAEGGDVDISGAQDPQDTEKKNAESDQLNPLDHVEGDPTTTGGNPGDGAEKLSSQPREGETDVLGQMRKEEHDSKSNKSALTDEPRNINALDCPTAQTTAEERDDNPGSTSIKENISLHTEDGNDQSREPSSKPEKTDIQDSQQELPSKPNIQDSEEDSDEPMELGSEGENSESRVPLSNSDKTVTQDPQNDPSEEMEVDDTTGQTSTTAGGVEHAAEGEKEGTGQAVSSEIVESEPTVDTGGAVASGTDQADSSEMVESEHPVDTAGAVASGTDQASSSEMVESELPVNIAGAMGSGTDQGGSSEMVESELPVNIAGVMGSGTDQSGSSEMVESEPLVNTGGAVASDGGRSEMVESEPPVNTAGAMGSGTDQAGSSEMVESEPPVHTAGAMGSGTDQAGSSEMVESEPSVDTAGAMGSGTDQAGSSAEEMGSKHKDEGAGHSDTSAEAGIDPKRSTEAVDETVAEVKHIAEGETGGAGEGHTSAEAGNNQNHTTKGVGDGNRQDDSQAKAKTKRKKSPQEKDDDDDDEDDIIFYGSGYGYRSGRSWASKDTQRYRSGYRDTEERDDLRLDRNYKFYTNQICSEPDGDLIENIHDNWKGNYTHLEVHHGYIQWLFPIRERGLNWHAQELQPHEIKRICDDPVAHKRILTSYELMLDFYGMKLKDAETGEIERAGNWEKRFRHLNRSMHNYLRITRILKCLGEFDYEHLKAPFVRFVLHEAIIERTLDNTIDSCLNYWLEVIKDDKERKKIKKYARELQGARGNPKKKKK